MDQLQLPHAKLLYYITELFKQKLISEDEKIKLKEMVISSDSVIFHLLEEWDQHSNMEKLKDGILNLVNPV